MAATLHFLFSICPETEAHHGVSGMGGKLDEPETGVRSIVISLCSHGRRCLLFHHLE